MYFKIVKVGKLKMPVDILERPIKIDDYVVFHNLIYQILEFAGSNYVKMILLSPAKTTRPVKKYGKFTCIIDKEEILIWKIKKGF